MKIKIIISFLILFVILLEILVIKEKNKFKNRIKEITERKGAREDISNLKNLHETKEKTLSCGCKKDLACSCNPLYYYPSFSCKKCPTFKIVKRSRKEFIGKKKVIKKK